MKIQRVEFGALLWDADDVLHLWNIGIQGRLVGAFSQAPNQNQLNGLPLFLSTRELSLVVQELGVDNIKIVECPKFSWSLEDRKVFVKSLSNADAVVSVDSVWRVSELQKLAIDAIEGERKPRSLAFQYPIASFQNSPCQVSARKQPTISRLLSTGYTELPDNKCCFTNGLRFGADYALYSGDPLRYHSHHLVHEVLDPHELREMSLLLSWGRVAHTSKKVALVACSEYSISVEWAGF